jgi:hypothetical protein
VSEKLPPKRRQIRIDGGVYGPDGVVRSDPAPDGFVNIEDALAEIEAWRAWRDTSVQARRGAKEKRRRREEDGAPDEPEWVARAVKIAHDARIADPLVTSTYVVKERIQKLLTDVADLPGFDRLMQLMRQWEADDRVHRRAKAPSSAFRGKRRKLQTL